MREGTWVEKQVVGGVTQSCRVCVYWGRAALTPGRNKTGEDLRRGSGHKPFGQGR